MASAVLGRGRRAGPRIRSRFADRRLERSAAAGRARRLVRPGYGRSRNGVHFRGNFYDRIARMVVSAFARSVRNGRCRHRTARHRRIFQTERALADEADADLVCRHRLRVGSRRQCHLHRDRRRDRPEFAARTRSSADADCGAELAAVCVYGRHGLIVRLDDPHEMDAVFRVDRLDCDLRRQRLVLRRFATPVTGAQLGVDVFDGLRRRSDDYAGGSLWPDSA